MSAVGPMPGPDLNPCPVVDAPSAGAVAAGTALPLLPHEAGKQVVDGVVGGPAIHDSVVAGGGNDVEDRGPAQCGGGQLAYMYLRSRP